MKKIPFCILFFLSCLLILSPICSYSLERDYMYSGCDLDDGRDPDEEDEDGDYIYYYRSNELCYECFNRACNDDFPLKYRREFNSGFIPPIVSQKYNECSSCYTSNVIYSGYFHFRYKGDYPFLKRQIDYSKKYPQYQAYWPETSHKAEKISDVAVILFEELINSTALKKVKKDRRLLNKFIADSWYFETFTHSRSLIATCFRFSDFYQVCRDLVQFSKTHFSEKENALIEDKIDAILDRLCGMFLEIYEESLLLHPTVEIKNEIDFIDLLYCPKRDIKIKKCQIGSIDFNRSKHFARELKIDIFKSYAGKPSHVINSINDSNSLPDWLMADYWLHEGIRLNDLFLHAEAISYLTAAIEKQPSIEAYQERLHAYFEVGNLSLAIEDYHKLLQLENDQKNILRNQFGYISQKNRYQGIYILNHDLVGMADYAGGFCIGITQGSAIALIEFVPSTWSCCKGILHGLWSFACSPTEVSSDLINASYDLVKFIKENTASECLETIVPELKDLCVKWEILSDYDKGNRIGYIIGKYGIDILAPGASLKGVKKYQQLKRLNSMFTVECCVASEAKKAKIIEASSKHASIRTNVSDLATTGKVIPRNANVIPHVMQERHAWEKLIKISGDKVEDFKKVSVLLEESEILSKKHLIESEKFHNGKIIRSDYRNYIEGYEVHATFETCVESNQTFLKDAWVIIKK